MLDLAYTLARQILLHFCVNLKTNLWKSGGFGPPVASPLEEYANGHKGCAVSDFLFISNNFLLQEDFGCLHDILW